MNKTWNTLMAEKHERSDLWTAKDALHEAIRSIKAGEIPEPNRLMLVMTSPEPERGLEAENIDTFYVNMDCKTRIAMLSAALQKEIETYRGKND